MMIQQKEFKTYGELKRFLRREVPYWVADKTVENLDFIIIQSNDKFYHIDRYLTDGGEVLNYIVIDITHDDLLEYAWDHPQYIITKPLSDINKRFIKELNKYDV